MSAPFPGVAPSRPAGFTVEWSDTLAGLGALLTVGGAYAIHPGLALAAVGAGLLGLAWRLS